VEKEQQQQKGTIAAGKRHFGQTVPTINGARFNKRRAIVLQTWAKNAAFVERWRGISAAVVTHNSRSPCTIREIGCAAESEGGQWGKSCSAGEARRTKEKTHFFEAQQIQGNKWHFGY
jgi:hypothetical protein